MDTYHLHQIQPELITPERFRPYGQVIFATDDDKAFDTSDAQLQLSPGNPRFYIMRLYQRGRRFHKITRHQCCTQCLGSLNGKEWLIGVAPPSEIGALHWQEIAVFGIPGSCFIKLDLGTWHAGPYFDGEFVDFYNLELPDTNLLDHDTCNLLEHCGVEVEILS